MKSQFLAEVRKTLKKMADSKKAPQMQAYMKSSMPYHGVPSPVVRKACRTVFANAGFSTAKNWKKEVRTIWQGAEFREERYAALHLASHKAAAPYQRPSSLDLYEELIVTGAWWDYVDEIAIHKVGPIVGEFPTQMKKEMLAFSKSSDIWKRRTSIICQIALKERTDLDFLYQCIEPSMDSDEFFLRKAIGWALRQIAWRDPKEVVRYVRTNKDRLSPLSKREALKNILRSGKLAKIP
jgi:3-methyladenine DNA glycosylase AlkD